MSASKQGWAARAWAMISKRGMRKSRIKDTIFAGDVPDDIILVIVDILAAQSKHGTIAALRLASRHHYNLITAHLYKPNPFPDEVMLHIVGFLKANHLLRSIAALRSTTQHNYRLITPDLYRDIEKPGSLVRFLPSIQSSRPVLAALTPPTSTFNIKQSAPTRARLHFAFVQSITLDSLTIERLAKLLYHRPLHPWSSTHSVIAQLRQAGHEILPGLKHLVYRYDERDPGRTRIARQYQGEDTLSYQWDHQRGSFTLVQLPRHFSDVDARDRRYHAYADQAQDSFKAKTLCVIPQPAALGMVPRLTRFDPDSWIRKSTANCAFRASFATIHNVNGKPCQLPNAKVVRVVFLADGVAVTQDPQNQAVDHRGGPINRQKRYDELLLIIRGMLANLADDVMKVVFVGIERGIDPSAVSDITRDQFYHKVTKAIRRARQSRDRRLDREGKPHQKLRLVMFDGKVAEGQEARRCVDCGTVM